MLTKRGIIFIIVCEIKKAEIFMKFKKVELKDFGKLKKILNNYTGRICDISPANLVMWRDYYDISYYLGDDGYAFRFGDMDDTVSYYCEANKELVKKIIASEGGSACFSCLAPSELEFFKQNFDCNEARHDRDWDDYIYNSLDIIELAGRRYSGQRNHINRFNKLYPDAVFEEITDENIKDVKAFNHGYFHEFGNEKAKVAEYEEKYLEEQLDNLDIYSQCTGVLKVSGEIVGFSIGEIVGKTLIVHTEKANTKFSGVYPALVNLFAKKYAPDTLYINREEDCGEAGLRTSKLSYHPIEILEKYALVAKIK